MKNTNSQVLKKTFAFSLVRFTLARFTLVRFVLAAILVPALLIGSAFTFGGSKLQAQANGSSKQGFFAGFVYLSGFKVDTTTLVTTNSTTYTDAITTGYRITGSSDATSIVVTGGNPYWDGGTPAAPIVGPTATGLRALVKANCENPRTTSVDSTGNYYFGRAFFDSFDSGAKPSTTDINNPLNDATVTFGDSTIPSKNFRTGLDAGEISHCFRYFFGDDSDDRNSITLSAYEIATPDSIPTPTSVPADPTAITSSKSDKISGIGLQFGFRWEKWRASLTHFTGSGGDNELANTLVMADYFVNKGLFVGGGLASMKLTNSLTSGSATSPAVRIGYKQKLTPNLSLNFGLTKYISGVSLKSSVTTTNNTTTANANTIVLRSFEETQTSEPGDSATIGARNVRIPGTTCCTAGGEHRQNNSAFEYLSSNQDNRIQATQVRSRTVYINKIQIPAGASETQTTTTTETAAELKAPLVISISFHLSF